MSSSQWVAKALALQVVGVALLSAPGCGTTDEARIDLVPSSASGSPCSNDAGCAVPSPYCEPIGRVCVECLTDANCGKKVCDAETFSCQDCMTSGDCSGSSPYCTNGDCVECLAAGNCPNENETCDTVEGKCVATCASDDDCTDRASIVCAPERALCVECLTDADCDTSKPRCIADKCRQCATDLDCNEDKPWCTIEKWECKECVADEHCAAGTHCDNGTCKE